MEIVRKAVKYLDQEIRGALWSGEVYLREVDRGDSKP